jgi:hypothetical protein
MTAKKKKNPQNSKPQTAHIIMWKKNLTKKLKSTFGYEGTFALMCVH